MPFDQLVKIVQILSYIAGAAAAVSAVFVYRNNSRRERARWVESLYSRFFEKGELKEVRDTLDCDSDDAKVNALVTEEGSGWTDYLNFFELVAYLRESKQLAAEDVKALFEYYIGCLKRHRSVVQYIRDESKGFKYLRRLLHQT
ncbi:MAG: hypothetical protein JWN74_1992 [Acidobacteriaceae bacterium]|nr:hypothetical protein [Acidobacteriaceae bacterium]